MNQGAILAFLFALLLGSASVLHAITSTGIMRAIESGLAVPLDALPGVSDLDLSESVRNFLHSITLVKPVISRGAKVAFITAGVTYQGQALEIRIRITAQDKWSILIGLPQGFHFGTVDPLWNRMDQLVITRAFLVLNTADSYLDPEWNLTVEPGFNIILGLNVTGILEKLLRIVPHFTQKEVLIQGSITRDFVNSSFRVQLPGFIKLGSFAESIGLIFAVYIKRPPGVLVGPLYDFTFAIQTGFKIMLPGSTEPKLFIGEIQFNPTAGKYLVSAWLPNYWNDAFGIKGLGIGDLGFGFGQSVEVVAASLGSIPISEICLRGGLKIGSKALTLMYCGDLTLQDNVLSGTIEGGLYLQDFLDFGIEVIERSSNTLQQKPLVLAQLHNLLPHIGFKKFKVYVVPKSTTIMGKLFDEGIDAEVVADILGKDVGLGISVNSRRIFGRGFIEEFTIGPVTIGGTGSERIKGTMVNAASVGLSVDPSNLTSLAEFFIDGKITLDLKSFGTLKAAGRLELRSNGIEIQIMTKLFDHLDAYLKFWANGVVSPMARMQVLQDMQRILDNPAASEEQRSVATKVLKYQERAFNEGTSCGIHVRVRSTVMEALSDEIKKEAVSLIVESKNILDQATQNAQAIDQSVAEYDKKIAVLEYDVVQLQQQYDRDVAQVQADLNTAQAQLAALDGLKKEVDEQMMKCAGKQPQEIKTIQEVMQNIPIDTATQKEAVQRYIQTSRVSKRVADRLSQTLQASVNAQSSSAKAPSSAEASAGRSADVAATPAAVLPPPVKPMSDKTDGIKEGSNEA